MRNGACMTRSSTIARSRTDKNPVPGARRLWTKVWHWAARRGPETADRRQATGDRRQATGDRQGANGELASSENHPVARGLLTQA